MFLKDRKDRHRRIEVHGDGTPACESPRIKADKLVPFFPENAASRDLENHLIPMRRRLAFLGSRTSRSPSASRTGPIPEAR